MLAGSDSGLLVRGVEFGSRDDYTADELLGSYALASQIASGHLTTLHRAHAASDGNGSAREPPGQARATNAALVVKRLLYGHVHEQADRELLLAAGRAGMRVRSPHVVRVLAVHEDPEPFIVMEHIQGVPLSTLLADTLDQEVLRYVFPILVDVLEGLELLHGLRDATGTAASLVHGAPSARHVLIGDDGVARLIDLTHAAGPGFRVAARRSLRLLPAEMAPEQVLAPMHVDARCDLFIVGTVLWRALTGQPLFEHAQREEALQQLLRKPILAPSEAGSPLGKRFDRICLRALARSRAERYVSAAEMARELKAEAERASLYASRDEIASLVRTLAMANQDAEETNEILLTATVVSSDTEAHAATTEAQGRELDETLAGASSVEPDAELEAHARAPHPDALDILTIHHQGSSRFGFARGALAARDAQAAHALHASSDGLLARGPARLDAAQAALTEAMHSVSEFAHERGGEPSDEALGLGSRDSGTWYEGLPSIFPNREEPRNTAPFWLWGIAAAAALLGSVLIDNPPWQVAERVREPSLSMNPSTVRSDMAAGPAGYAAFFEIGRSMKSSALPPRVEKPAADTSALLCAPAESPAPALAAPGLTPALEEREPDALHTVNTLAPEAAPPRPRAGKRFLSPLPPNPY